MQATTTRRVVRYETRQCGRCGGTGAFGPMSVENGRCFSCAGGGRVLTAKGKRAKAAIEAWRDEHYGVAASQVRVGDIVWYSGGGVYKPGWRKVVDVTTDLDASGRDSIRTSGGLLGPWGGGSIGAGAGLTTFSTLGRTSIDYGKTGESGAAHRAVRRFDPELAEALYEFAASLSGATVEEK